jgi:hypothetical protein
MKLFTPIRILLLAAVLAAAVITPLLLIEDDRPATGAPSVPGRTLHYAANSNFDTGSFLLGQWGFDLADVSSPSQLAMVPPGTQALVYLGSCDGATDAFRAAVDGYQGRAAVWGFYLIDEPDPSTCPAANLRAEADYIHATQPRRPAFILEQNISSSKTPRYFRDYSPDVSHLDLIGIDPYPCRSELGGCDIPMIEAFVTAAIEAGIPKQSIVPVYQAFGGGEWVDDGDGKYLMPTADQAHQILAAWDHLIPHPAFDFVYSWGSQRGDASLATAPGDLLDTFAHHNT